MRLANLKNDYAFKYVYGAGTEKSNAALIGLLTVFLKRKVIRVAVQNPELIMPDPKEKEPVVDILVTFDDGDRVDVEMQASMVNDYLFKRFEYYLCRIHSKQQIKGQKYYKLKKSIVLAFVDGVLFPDNMDCFYNVFQYQNQDNKPLDKFLTTLIIVELPKLKNKDVKDMDTMERYMYYLNHCQEGPDSSNMKMILDEEEDVRMAEECVKDINDDCWEDLNQFFKDQCVSRLDFEDRLKEEVEYHVKEATNKIVKEVTKEARQEGLQEGLQQGIEQGLQQGVQQNLKQNILNMSEVMSPEDIAKVLKLPLKQVQSFLK